MLFHIALEISLFNFCLLKVKLAYQSNFTLKKEKTPKAAKASKSQTEKANYAICTRNIYILLF